MFTFTFTLTQIIITGQLDRHNGHSHAMVKWKKMP